MLEEPSKHVSALKQKQSTHKTNENKDEAVEANKEYWVQDNNTSCCGCRYGPSILKGSKLVLPKQSLREYFEEKLSDGHIQSSSVAIIIDTMSQFSYKDLNEISNCFASIIQNKLGHNFKNKNLDNDIVIGVCLPPSLQFHVHIVFAILKLGATYFPINSKYSEELIFNLSHEAQPVVTILSSQDSKTVQKYEQIKMFGGGGVILTYEDLTTSWYSEGYSKIPPVAYLEDKNPNYPKPKDRTVVIIPCTNSAGIYTGVRYQSHAIFNLVFWTNTEFPYAKGETVLSLFETAPDCVEAVKEIFSTLFSGSTLVILSPEIVTHPTGLLDKIKNYNVRRLTLWPRFLLNILWTMEIIGLQVGNSLMASVKYYICIGDPISVELAKMFFMYIKPNKKLVSVYGQDEDLSAVAAQVYDSLDTVDKLDYCNNLPVGQPIVNIKMYVVSPSKTLVRNGVVGEICISGPVLSEQYGKSEAPPQNLSKNPFSKAEEFLLSTGDYGRIVKSKDGVRRLIFEFSSEKNVHLEEHFFNLEEIASHMKLMKDLVSDFHIMFYQVGNDTQSLIVFCCLKHPADLSIVKENLASKLPPFAMPDVIAVEGEKLPLEVGSTEESKQVNKKTLLTLYENERAKRKDSKHLKNLKLNSSEEMKAAQVLLLIIANLMSIPIKLMIVKLDTSFKAFGGSNFKSVMIIRELHKNRYPITIEEFTQSKSLMEIILKMVERRAARGVVELDIFGLSVSENYQLEEMTKADKDEVISVLCHSLTMKDQLEYYSAIMTPKLLERLLLKQWPQFVEKPLSLTLKRLRDKKIVGGILCLDWNNRKPVHRLSIPVNHRIELQNILEEPYVTQQKSSKASAKSSKNKEVVKHEKAFQIVHFGTLNNLFTFEGLYEITKKMITEAIAVAKNNNFDIVLISVVDFYVAAMCEQELDFTVVSSYQANMFTAEDNIQPYVSAPDWLECKFMMKKINANE